MQSMNQLQMVSLLLDIYQQRDSVFVSTTLLSTGFDSPSHIHVSHQAFVCDFHIIDLCFHLCLHQFRFVQLHEHQEKLHHNCVVIQYFSLITLLNLQGQNFFAHHFWIISLLGLLILLNFFIICICH